MKTIDPPATIAFVGLGRMGAPMVGNLLRAGFRVHGCDLARTARSEAAALGAKVFETPREAAEGADILIAMLPDGSAVRDAVLGENGGARPLGDGGIVIDMSSSSPTGTLALHADLRALDRRLVDAPVSGGRRRAIDGSLTVMAGGESAAIDAIAPVLTAMGQKIFKTGASGSGHAMKALNNFVSGAGAIAAMEAIILGRSFGLDPEIMVDILNVSTGRNNTTEVKMKPFVLSGAWNSGFSLALMAKDIRIAADLAASMGMSMETLAETANRWEAALCELGQAADHTEIFRYLDLHANRGS